MQAETLAQTERRAQSHNLINELIHTRTEMLAQLNGLVQLKPFTEADDDTVEMLQEFCEVLVDYTASAHFRLYRYIDERIEKRQAVLDLADLVYPRILKTTDAIVEFNDKYEAHAGDIPEKLEHDLSVLGEMLAERIELEDQLIAILSSGRS